MNRNLNIMVIGLLTGMLVLSCGGEPAKSKKTHSLFNQKDLDGWYTFLKDRGRDNDPKRVFTVTDGVLRISGEEWGCITTREEFENYHLITEFRWGDQTYEPRKDRARDSGILLHSVGSDGDHGGIWMYSIECQIIEGGTGDFLVVGDQSPKYSITCLVGDHMHGSSPVFQPDGKAVTIQSGRINWYGRDPGWKDTLGFRGNLDVEKPAGDWNTLECIAMGDSLTAILNGVVVNQAFHVRPVKGRIQIQSEGAEIFFRRIELMPW